MLTPAVRRLLVTLVALVTGAASSLVIAPAATAQPPAVAIDRVAECHRTRCFVRVDFSSATRGQATVRAGNASKRLRITRGDSARVVQFPRAELRRPVRVAFDGARARARVQRQAMTVNRNSTRCARLGATEANLSVGPASRRDASVNLPSLGTLRAAVLFIDFPDAPGSGDPRPGNDTWMRGGIDVLERTSHGRFSIDLDATTPGWVRMPEPLDSYGFGDGLTYEEHQIYIQDAIDAADPSVDFTGIDLPLIVIPDTASLVGSQAFRGLPGALSSDEGGLAPAVTFGADGADPIGVTFEHELAHTLGLPDLYAFDEFQIHEYVGLWDWMGSIFEPRTDLFAWNKTRLGWLRPTQTLCAATSGPTAVVLAPLAGRQGTKSVFVRTGRYTGVMIENRGRSDLDPGVCRPGVLVATLDSRVDSGFGPIRVIGGRSDDDGCGTGPRSDATLRVGRAYAIGSVTVNVVGRQGRALEVIVDAG